MVARYRVTLTEKERSELSKILKTGKRAAFTIRHSQALLLLDKGEFGSKRDWSVENVAEALNITARPLEKMKKRFVEEGLEAAITRKKRLTPPRETQFGGKFEAHLLALACTESPEGTTRWTIKLLKDKMIELELVETVSETTIGVTLKKTNLSLI